MLTMLGELYTRSFFDGGGQTSFASLSHTSIAILPLAKASLRSIRPSGGLV